MAIYIDDRELVAAHQAGDGEAFGELVREHRRSLLAHAQRKLHCDASAEDALQETLVRAYKALPKFDGEYRLGPWMHRIMHNVCIDEAVRRRRDGEKTNNFAAQPTSRLDAPSVEDELGLQFDDSQLQSALDELSDPYREALGLRFIDELEYDQVAKLSGVSEQNARARVSRARSAMRAAIKGVAMLPVFLLGLLKRGEKAAAAATSGSLASGTVGVTTASTVTAQVASSSAVLPTLAEAGVVAAKVSPVVVPVVAKAAMGLGLAAAVLAPGGGGAVQLAVDNLTNTSGGFVVEEIVDSSNGLLGAQKDSPVVMQSGSVASSELSDQGSLETLSPSAPASNRIDVVPEQPKPSSPITGVGGSFSAEALTVVPSGAGRFDISGAVSITVGTEKFDGSLTTSSQIRVDPEVDVDGRHRIDALSITQLSDGAVTEIRVAGFGVQIGGALELGGLFRADYSDSQLVPQGSFEGSLALGDPQGSLLLILNP